MSAHNDPNAARDGDYSFKMPQKIPADLLAIAAGDLVFRPISERSGVWAGPAMVEKAQAEFEDTEKMIETAASLYGPYRWGRYRSAEQQSELQSLMRLSYADVCLQKKKAKHIRNAPTDNQTHTTT